MSATHWSFLSAACRIWQFARDVRQGMLQYGARSGASDRNFKTAGRFAAIPGVPAGVR